MAQTKTRASSKRSAGSKNPQARSRGSTKKSANSRKRASSRKQPTPAAAVSDAADKATSAAGNAAGKAASAVGTAAGKAKVPLIASGAALAGAAGGAAIGVHQARRHRRARRGLAKTAKGVGTLGAQVGHLAYELQRNRESTNGGGQHRSPLEVVLEGLTARRSRS
jgi:hypothetical protein